MLVDNPIFYCGSINKKKKCTLNVILLQKTALLLVKMIECVEFGSFFFCEEDRILYEDPGDAH